MGPETIAAVMGAVGVIGGAAVTAGPAYLTARRTRTVSEDEGQATRDAVDVAVSRIEGRIDGAVDELRAGLAEVRDWQTSHTAEHVLLDYNRNPPTDE